MRGGGMLKALRDVRSLRVLILHPADRDRDDLAAQVRRIGCRVEAQWPPPAEIPSDVEIVFLLFREEAIANAAVRALQDRTATLTLIAIVEFESPTVIDAIVRAGTAAVITKPIRAFGLLTAMIVAHTLLQRNKVSSDRIAKLQSRLEGIRRIEQAKAILITRKGLTEAEAYESIRRRAMTKRVSMETICQTIIEANEVFGP